LGTFAARGAEGRRPGWDKNGAVASLLVGHLSGHVAGALAIARVARSGLIRRIAPTFVRYPVAFLASSVVGTGILVSYLRLADRWGLHGLEAFSGMRIDGYKCHLRLEVHEDDVRVHVIVIDDVPTAQCAELNDLPPLRARVLKTICVTRTKQLGEDTAPPVPSGPRDSRQA
jgi:hypothetical protein